MKQEYRDLLLKELCTRLAYGVKVNAPFTTNKNENAKGYKINSINFRVIEWTPTLFGEKKQRNGIIIETFIEKYNEYCAMDLELNNDIEKVKLYLFPLSSMTEEQKEEVEDKLIFPNNSNGGWIEILNNDKYNIPFWFIDFCNKNHLDYRGLIEKGLAIDATNKNIY